MVDDNTYVCAACKGEFTKGWNEAEAMAEWKRDYPDTPDSERIVVCDDCHIKIEAFKKGPQPPVTLAALTERAVKLVERCYAQGRRMEGWHLLACHASGYIEVVELPMALPRPIFKTLMIPFVRHVLERERQTCFAVVCEAWVVTQDQMADGKGARAKELKRIKKEGISQHPHRMEVINLSVHSANGGASMRAWKIAYDDMRKPRLGELIWTQDVDKPSPNEAMETWWTRVFDAPKETRQ